ncbi:hypothetical protein ACIPT2_01250 [Pectobacterium brasiliense]|uniref:hypothetical protein n=1 Tax=Pectobacterium brasiliense TaxID=180957 RepID=UPI003826998A
MIYGVIVDGGIRTVMAGMMSLRGLCHHRLCLHVKSGKMLGYSLFPLCLTI